MGRVLYLSKAAKEYAEHVRYMEMKVNTIKEYIGDIERPEDYIRYLYAELRLSRAELRKITRSKPMEFKQ